MIEFRSERIVEEKKEDHYSSFHNAPSKPLLYPHDPSSSPRMSASLNVPKSKESSASALGLLGRFVVFVLSFSARSFLFLCLLAFAMAHLLSTFHDDYFVPIVQRARRTDEDLWDEFTYYERECSVVDVTAGPEDAQDLYIRPDSRNYGVDQMMTYGSVLFPNLLKPDTVQALRKFVVEKNAAIEGTAAEFPVSQGYKRISFGIEATEHPAVVRALKQIHDNEDLQHLLEGLLGENPALTEITAITARYGCDEQAWHPDVKPDGNGVMFGRTYSHSYSLFIPLQNTTGAMGATDFCPGTHYCATMDLHEVCEGKKIGMHQVSGQGFWPEGSAALFNQQVWHRGAKHNDPNAEERVVFIVSFLARPNDTRQLSRGTYFHMKWNMWGHTWADLNDAMKFMSWPWNVFTCLHIWRPPSNGWGYDLITSAAMRIGNNQLGCEPEDLEKFLETLANNGFPEWLDGTIDMDRMDAWEVYIRETITNIWNFLFKVYKNALGGYFVLLLLTAGFNSWHSKSGLRSMGAGTRSVLLIHGFVVALSALVLWHVRSRPWAVDITKGRMLMRPFPPFQSTLASDPAVSTGPSTLPKRQDVLFGGRLDTKTIGAYNRWLEFHPGNREFLLSVEEFGGSALYRSYLKDFPPIFQEAVVNATVGPILLKGGRFLQQDYRSGDWLWMTDKEQDVIVQRTLFIGSSGPLFELQKELNFIVGDARFGFSRETSMAKTSLGLLRDLDTKLFGRFVREKTKSKVATSSVADETMIAGSKIILDTPSGNAAAPKRNWIIAGRTSAPESSAFTIGQEVIFKLISLDGGFKIRRPGTLVNIVDDEYFDIAPYPATIEEEDIDIVLRVPQAAVKEPVTLHVGSLVWARYDEDGKFFPGRIVSVWPNGNADIEFDDGEFEEGIPPDDYKLRY